MPKRKKRIDEEVIGEVPEIDAFNLDYEWVKQPGLYGEFAERLAKARKVHSEAEAAFKRIKAEVETDIRSSPSDYDLEKVTEASIEATVVLQDEYQEAQQAVIDAKYIVDRLQGKIYELDQRKKGCENLVELRLADYFSEPRAKGDTRRLMEEYSDRRTHEKMHKASKKKRRRERDDEDDD